MSDDNEGFFVVGGGGDDIPEEIKKLLHHITTGGAQQEGREQVGDVLQPSAEQYKLGPGDLCVIIEDHRMASEYTSEYQLIKIEDPEEFKETFPDWEERLTLRSHLFGMVTEDEEQWVPAWIPRVQLIPIEPWQWDALVAHNTERALLDVPCTWLILAFGRVLTDISQANGDKDLPESLSCGECGERVVMVELTLTKDVMSLCGVFTHSEQRKTNELYGLSSNVEKHVNKGRLHCLACDATTEFSLDEHPVSLT